MGVTKVAGEDAEDRDGDVQGVSAFADSGDERSAAGSCGLLDLGGVMKCSWCGFENPRGGVMSDMCVLCREIAARDLFKPTSNLASLIWMVNKLRDDIWELRELLKEKR